jgi:hypothetical protein
MTRLNLMTSGRVPTMVITFKGGIDWILSTMSGGG